MIVPTERLLQDPLAFEELHPEESLPLCLGSVHQLRQLGLLQRRLALLLLLLLPLAQQQRVHAGHATHQMRQVVVRCQSFLFGRAEVAEVTVVPVLHVNTVTGLSTTAQSQNIELLENIFSYLRIVM